MTEVNAVGLGLRVPIAESLFAEPPDALDWLEVAPENFMRRGGRYSDVLRKSAARWPLVTHGLSMSLGGTDPLDRHYLHVLRDFVRDVGTPWHSDHLSFGFVDGAALHELLPLSLTRKAADHVAARIRHVQDILGIPFAVENVTAYARPAGAEMDEAEFVTEIVRGAGCHLLLDVNNVYVNARNFGLDPKALLGRMPLDRVVQIHVAGHDDSDPELIVDTHAEAVVPGVLQLLEWALERTGPVPVLLERDDHFPEWDELCAELRTLRAIVDRAARVCPVLPVHAPARSTDGGAIAPRLDDYTRSVKSLCFDGDPLATTESAGSSVLDPALGLVDQGKDHDKKSHVWLSSSVSSRSPVRAGETRGRHGRSLELGSSDPGDEPWRWNRYRKMVRRRLFDVIEHALPRFSTALGQPRRENLFERFLAASGPRTPFIRDVPGEFVEWFGREELASDLPRYARDLARFEWARTSVGYDEDEPPVQQITELTMHRPAVLRRAHRLLALGHAVHRDAEASPVPEELPVFLCVYRDPETHLPRTLELTSAAFALLESIAPRDVSLATAVHRIATRDGQSLDSTFLEAASALLADLSARGLLVGSLGIASRPPWP